MCSVGWRVQRGQSAQRQRGAHQLEEIAAAFDGVFIVGPSDSLTWEFPLQEVLEFGGGGEFVEAAPILFACAFHRAARERGEIQFLVVVRSSVARRTACQYAYVRGVVFGLEAASDLFLVPSGT